MADQEVKVKFTADLGDVVDAVKGVEKATGNLQSVAGVNIDNVVGKLFVLKEGFNAVTAVAGAVVRSIKAVTIDLMVMGEQAEQVDNGFRMLAEGAGLAGEELRQAIINAANGTIETTNLIQKSGALVSAFGQSAQRIPELVELSRKVARSFGLDTEESFNRISQAIQGGNTKALKQLGIYVDTEKAVRDYARENGVAANAITDVGRAQAILNAALTQGNKKFGDVSLSGRTLSESLALIKNNTADLLEVFGQLLSKVGLGQNTLDNFGRAIGGVSTLLKATFGNDTSAQVDVLKTRLSLLYADLNDVTQKKQGFFGWLFGDTKETIERDIEATKRKIQELEASKPGEMFGPPLPPSAKAKVDPAAVENDAVDKEKLKQNELAFQREVNQARLQSAEAKLKLSLDEEALKVAQQERQVAQEAMFQQRIDEIKNNSNLSKQQQEALMQEQRMAYAYQQLENERLMEQERMAMLQRRLEAETSFGAQMAGAAEVNAMRAAEAWRRSGGLGGAAMNAFSNRTIAAFQAMGNGSKTAGEALKGAFFGMLGDMASAQGQFMFLSSIWPPNPAGMAAGLGLIALGSMLSSMGGGAAETGGAGIGGGGGGAGSSDGFGGPSIGDARQDKKQAVSVTIQGNYFDNEQSRMAIVEAVRSASDATDFTVQRGNRK